MKNNTGKIEVNEKGKNEGGENKFELQYDRINKRVSYKVDFRDHCTEELYFIAGVLDMLYLLFEAEDGMDQRGDEIPFVIRDARERAKALQDIL